MPLIRQERILVLGIDAMDVELVRRWAAAGYLPTFRRLFESSGWTDYVDCPEDFGGIPWPSINTGLSPLQHDLYHYMRLRRDSYRMRLARADDVKGDPFWKWFVQSGRRIVLADVPYSIPRPDYGGRQFCGWGQHDRAWKKNSVPNRLLSALSDQFGDHPVPHCQKYSTETESLRRFKAGLLIAIERRTAIFKSLIGARDWDLFYGAYSEAHCGGHLLWHLEDESHPQHSREQLTVVGHALRDIYVAIDRAVGMLAACTDGDTTFVIFFSHGIGPNYQGGHLFAEFVDRFNRRWLGKDTHLGQEESRLGSLDHWWERTVGRMPAGWRARVKNGLPVRLRIWIGMQREQNPNAWSRMPAFSLPQDGFSALRVNLAGREPRGWIQPGEQYRRYIDAFIAELSRLKNGTSGEAAVDYIFRADQRVDPLTMGSGPDLNVWWSKSSPICTIRSPTLGTISGEFTDARTGNHVMRGMLLISHPQARLGRHTIPGMNILDIPATLCDLAGIEAGVTLKGTSRLHNLVTH